MSVDTESYQDSIRANQEEYELLVQGMCAFVELLSHSYA
jgi:hypothetical protein